MYYCAGILLGAGSGHTVKNALIINNADDPNNASDYVDNSIGIAADKNISSDGTAPGTTTIQDAVAAEEWISPGTDFHLKEGAQALGFAETIAGYEYDFDDVVRAEPWDAGALDLQEEPVPTGSGAPSVPAIETKDSRGTATHVGSGLLSILAIATSESFGFAIHLGSGVISLPMLTSRGRGVKIYPSRPVYYSVGPDYGTNLKTGTPTISISNGIATFSVDQIGNIGVGDVVVYGGSRCFLAYKIDGRTWTVLDRLGFVPADVSATAVTSIGRCFVSVNAAVGSADGVTCRSTGVVGATFLGTRDLASNGIRLFITCYHGDGVDETGTIIIPGHISTGFLTESYNCIIIDAPGRIGELTYEDARVRSNSWQHSDGVPGTGYQIHSDDADAVIRYQDVNGIVNGIECSGDAKYGVRFNSTRSTSDDFNVRVKSCIIHNAGEYGIVFDATAPGYITNASAWNNIVYGQSLACIRKGAGVEGSVVVQQCTLDKGVKTGTVVGISCVDDEAYLIVGYNAFVGGQAEYDVMGQVPASIQFNVGQDAMFSRNLATWTNTLWDEIDITIADTDTYATIFVSRSGSNYRLLNNASPLYMRAWINYVNESVYPGARWGSEVMSTDLSGALWFHPEISVGALEYVQVFEFTGAKISSVTEDVLSYFTYEEKETQDNGEFITGAGETMYRVPGEITVPALDYIAEAKALMRLRGVDAGDGSGRRRLKLVTTLTAAYEYRTKTLVINKISKSYKQLLSRCPGDDNYIFHYDEQVQQLQVWTGVPVRLIAGVMA